MTEDHFDTAERYFNFLAQRFPVMCASDEFHFLPRATGAARYYDRLDNLSQNAIEECILELKRFQDLFRKHAASEENLEKQIDLELLIANATGVLIELEINCSWRCNPLFYLKIAFIGLDHAINKPCSDRREKSDRIAGRLSAIPRLLGQAVENLRKVPETYHRAAQVMLPDCREFLAEAAEDLSLLTKNPLDRLIADTLQALGIFEKFLAAHPPTADYRPVSSLLMTTLSQHFLSRRRLEDVFRIAADEWQKNLAALERLQHEIDPQTPWQRLYHDYAPETTATVETLMLYRQESERLRRFFHRQGFGDRLASPLELKETPLYLRSVRSSASFAAAFSSDPREISYFYITTRLPSNQGEQSAELLKKRFHREYKFLTAHETFPGHQLLDAVRRSLANPVRRQIESPLFYEGWATYVETLLIDLGYVTRPIERLVDYKRRLWRAARCQIDVGLQANFLAYDDALTLLTTNGFSLDEARRQIHRFRLNPGYQLCYSLGCYEIRNILRDFKSKQTDRELHRQILAGGQLPFHRIRQRIEAKAAKTDGRTHSLS